MGTGGGLVVSAPWRARQLRTVRHRPDRPSSDPWPDAPGGAVRRQGRASCRRVLTGAFLVALASVPVVSCGSDRDVSVPARETGTRAEPAAPAASRPSVARPRIVALGDSLTAGYGLPSKDDAFPALLQREIDKAGLAYEVVNMGVSGDTTAGGLRRLEWAMEGDVRVVIVALGGNDGLRGLGPEAMRDNLARIIDGVQERGARVLLCGMEAPPNLGSQYTVEFRQVYQDLAREKHTALLPFLLDGVAGHASLNQPDGIHPNQQGAARVAALVWAVLRPLLEPASTS